MTITLGVTYHSEHCLKILRFPLSQNITRTGMYNCIASNEYYVCVMCEPVRDQYVYFSSFIFPQEVP